MRTRLAWAGFGSLGGGLWITPHTERERELADVAGDGSAAELVSFRAELGALGEPARVVADAWDLDALADAYRAFVTRFGRMRARGPEAEFRAQTLLVHEWRRFPFLDPDLPGGHAPGPLAARAGARALPRAPRGVGGRGARVVRRARAGRRGPGGPERRVAAGGTNPGTCATAARSSGH